MTDDYTPRQKERILQIIRRLGSGIEADRIEQVSVPALSGPKRMTNDPLDILEYEALDLIKGLEEEIDRWMDASDGG